MELRGHRHVAAILSPGKELPIFVMIGDWEGPSADMDVVVKRNMAVPAGSRAPVIQPLASQSRSITRRKESKVVLYGSRTPAFRTGQQ
jgi:hypothetical protein